jgi:hypothetical protein
VTGIRIFEELLKPNLGGGDPNDMLQHERTTPHLEWLGQVYRDLPGLTLVGFSTGGISRMMCNITGYHSAKTCWEGEL